jgi:XTP/dITP diphosphohydrolase
MTEKKTLVFATQNSNKAKEVQGLLPDNIEVKTLADIGCSDDIPEEQPTLEGNALQKARYVKEHFNVDCFADDTGLEVKAIDGAPGVYSARFAGPSKDSNDNIDLLLKKLENKQNRSAQFRTVIALILEGKEYTFEGSVSGNIAKERHGEKGFGYDPIFIPENESSSFAQMSMEEKNKMSHRSRAIAKLASFLSK